MQLDFDLIQLPSGPTTPYTLTTSMDVLGGDGVFASDTLFTQTGEHWKVLRFSDASNFYINLNSDIGNDDSQFVLVGSIINGLDVHATKVNVTWSLNVPLDEISGTFDIPLLQTLTGVQYKIDNGVFTDVINGDVTNSPTAPITDHTLLTNIGVNTHAQIDSHISNTSNPHAVTQAQVGLGNVDNTSDLNKPISTATQTALDGKVDENAPITGDTKTKITYDAKGLVVGGVDATTLDINDNASRRYVTDAQILAWNALIGGSVFQTTWNATTNSPTLVSGVGTKGHYYIVSVAGSTNLDGITDWVVGDWAIYDGTAWQQVDNTDAVSSVNGLTGAVSLDSSNVPDTTNKRYITDAQLVVLGNTSGTNTGDNAVNTNSNSYADAKVVDAINDGTTTIAPSQNAVFDALALKQNVLVSGTSIKTIEGQSLLGSGNIDLVKADVGLSNVVNLDTSTTANITDSTNKRFVTDAQQTVIGNTSGTNTGDNAVNTLYSGLVSNATHTGEVTGATALTLDKTAITNKSSATVATGDLVLISDISDSNNLKQVTAQSIANLNAGVSDHTLLTNIGTNTHVQIDSHIANTSNPHGVTKTQISLGNVDNTSDLNKPISTATQTALDGKVDENASIVGATKTKITYDAKGLVTAGADATTADILDSVNKRYVTDAQQTVLGNTSGTNTGDNATNSQYSGLASSKENAITGTTSADFWSGAKTFINFATTVRGTVLTGLSLATNQVIAATDSVLQALGYLQKQITDLTSTVSGKQATLVSGTNIKTLEGQTLLGSGNIDLVKADVGLSNVPNLDTSTTANITDSTNKRFITDAQQTIIGNTSGTNTGDNAVNTLYSGLVSNATHTGEVTGSTVLTADKTLITNKATVTKDNADFVLISDTSDSGNLKKVLASDFAGGAFSASIVTTNPVSPANGDGWIYQKSLTAGMAMGTLGTTYAGTVLIDNYELRFQTANGIKTLILQ